MRVVAVDWSGCRTDDRGTWAATAVDGELVDVRPVTRAGAVDYLIDMALKGPVLAGLDFSFSFPQWVLDFIGEPPLTWERVRDEGEGWLSSCPPPFFGRKGTRRPDVPLFRQTELDLRAEGWWPKSIFQIAGPGAVGTGSIRGMPHLLRLAREGFGVWPFDDRWPRVVEIYPRVMTGRVVKRHLPNEHAFDASVSALVMSQHASRDISRVSVGGEGRVWVPPSVGDGADGDEARA